MRAWISLDSSPGPPTLANRLGDQGAPPVPPDAPPPPLIFFSRIDLLNLVRAEKLELGEEAGLEGGGDLCSTNPDGGGEGVRMEANQNK